MKKVETIRELQEHNRKLKLELEQSKKEPEIIEIRDKWNVYATEIWPDSVRLFVNDVLTLTYPRVEGKEKQFPWPDYPFYIILSNQLGGNWVGAVNKPEELPSELRVDWVKVYGRKK